MNRNPISMARSSAGRRTRIRHFPYSLSLNGANNSDMSLGNDIYQYERTQPFTIGFWLTPEAAITIQNHYFSEYLNGGGFRGRLIRQDTSLLRFWLINTFGSNELKINYTPPPRGKGVWLIFSYTGNSLASGVKCWFDHNLQAQQSVTETLSGTIVASGAETVWGGWTGGTLTAKGKMAGMFVCNYAFDQAMVDDFLYEGIFSGGAPIDYYPLTEGSGTSVASTGSGAHTGTLGAGVSWSSTVTPMKARSTISQNRLGLS